MKVDSPNKRRLQKKSAIFYVGMFSCMLVTSFFSMNGFTSALMVSGSVQSTDDVKGNIVHIVRDSTTGYSIVDNETEYIGAFDVSYSISGREESLIGSRDAIISLIQNDFSTSPTSGYIIAGNASVSSSSAHPTVNTLTLPNPFADSAAINQTINQEVSNAIQSAGRVDAPLVNIKCDFGADIEDWECVNQNLNPR